MKALVLAIWAWAPVLTACGGTAQPFVRAGANENFAAQPLVAIRPGFVSAYKPVGWGPHDLESAYNLPVATKGSGQIVAVVDAFDNPKAASDLAQYRSHFKLAAAKFTKYNQDGQTTDYPQGNPNWGLQIDLDVEMVSASCPNCTIYLIEANTNSGNDLEAAEAEAVALGAKIVSNSWAGKKLNQSYFDTPGVTYLGTDCCGFYASEPADFASVVAVGGTELSKGGSTRGWVERVAPFGGSGKCVKSIPRPRWQHDAYCRYRLANDVGAVDSDVAAYDSYTYQGWVELSGSSAPPFLAGVFALAGNAGEQDGGRTFWNRKHQKHLYPVSMAAGGECSYQQVNGNYNSCTGWGSPNGIGAF